MEQLPVPIRMEIRYNKAERRRMPCVRLDGNEKYRLRAVICNGGGRQLKVEKELLREGLLLCRTDIWIFQFYGWKKGQL